MVDIDAMLKCKAVVDRSAIPRFPCIHFSKRGYYSVQRAGSSPTGDEKQAIVVADFQESKAPQWLNQIACQSVSALKTK